MKERLHHQIYAIISWLNRLDVKTQTHIYIIMIQIVNRLLIWPKKTKQKKGLIDDRKANIRLEKKYEFH